jgi:acyl-CoA thioesterase FadM
VIAAEAESTMVVFDYHAGKSHPVPDELRAAIERIEGRKF